MFMLKEDMEIARGPEYKIQWALIMTTLSPNHQPTSMSLFVTARGRVGRGTVGSAGIVYWEW